MALLKDLLVSYEEVRPKRPITYDLIPDLYDRIAKFSGYKKYEDEEKDMLIGPLEPKIVQATLKDPNHVRIKRINNRKNYDKFIEELNAFSDKYGIDEQTKKELDYLAALESSYNQKAKSKWSSASGYFLFLDSTRKDYSNVSKEEFLNSPEEQFKAAVKYIKYLKNNLINPEIWRKGKERLSDFLILYGAWWRPKSIINYVENGKDDYVNDDGITLDYILKYAK